MREMPDPIRDQPPAVIHASSMTGPIRGWVLDVVGPSWLRTYGIASGMAALMSFTGANGTSEVPMAPRLVYWLVLMFGGTLIAQISGRFLDRYINLNLWKTILAMMLCITPLISIFVWGVTAAFSGQVARWQNLPAYLLPVLTISLAMAILHVLISREPAQSHAFTEPQTFRQPGGLLRERLPFKFRAAEIYALSAEDHYLRVHTSAGETLILMRLYDAIRELDGIEGSQTHRSWWVAKDAVSDVVKNDGRITLTLKGNITAPVSRSYQKTLKQDGWV